MKIKFKLPYRGADFVGWETFEADVHYDSWLVPPGFAGITIGSNIYLKDPAHMRPAPSKDLLLKHECVHVMQWERQGLGGFIARYLWSWAKNWFRYTDIAHEIEARGRAHTVLIEEA